MKTLGDHRRRIMSHYRNTIENYKTLFDLRVHMISINLCPSCGKYLNRYSSVNGHFPCISCDFNLTELEVRKISEDYRISLKMKMSILNRKLKLKNWRENNNASHNKSFT